MEMLASLSRARSEAKCTSKERTRVALRGKDPLGLFMLTSLACARHAQIACGDRARSDALLLQMQLYAPVELKGIFLRQPVAIGDRERLLPPFRHQRQLARIPRIAQKAGDRLKPLS